MARSALGIFVGFITWFVAFVAGEQILSLLLPEQFGVSQSAFQNAIEHGSQFTPQNLHLILHVVLASIACILAALMATVVCGHRRSVSITLGCLLLCVGLLKAALTWQLVPIWYHVAFTALLLPMTLIGAAIGSVINPLQRSPTSPPPVGT